MKRRPWFRFKTESEFIEEFGNIWKIIVHTSWATNGRMDCLLGEKINLLYNVQCLELWIGAKELFLYRGWNISRDMIKPINYENIR